jgi:hypothetical protein
MIYAIFGEGMTGLLRAKRMSSRNPHTCGREENFPPGWMQKYVRNQEEGQQGRVSVRFPLKWRPSFGEEGGGVREDVVIDVCVADLQVRVLPLAEGDEEETKAGGDEEQALL